MEDERKESELIDIFGQSTNRGAPFDAADVERVGVDDLASWCMLLITHRPRERQHVLMTCTSAVVGAFHRSAVRLSRRGPGPTPYRPISTSVTQYRGRDVLAKYQSRPPLVAAKDHVELDTGSTSLSDDFVTSSTQPAGTSFQTVPPPSSDAAQHGSYSKAPVPAMVAPESSTFGSAPGSGSEPSQRRKEIIVQGVPIPPKPTPPGEEGTSTLPLPPPL